MTWKQLRDQMKGKVFIIGLTFIDHEGKEIERYQTHGTVSKLTVDGFFKIKREDKGVFTIPYVKETIKAAKEGEYREKTTGKTIKNPDFIMTWEIKITNPDDLESIKKRGYLPTFKYLDPKNINQMEDEMED